MHRVHHLWLLLLIGLLGATGLCGATDRNFVLGEADQVFAATRILRYVLTVANPAAEPVEGGRLWVALLPRRTATQRCLRVDTSFPATIEGDGVGNAVLAIELPVLAGLAQKVLSVTCTIAYAEQPQPEALEAPETFLKAEPCIEANDARVTELGTSLHGDTVADTARRIDEWVRTHITDCGYTARDRGALACLAAKAGDCTEMAYLFAALCRANRIPARVVGGVRASANTVLRPTDYHNWAEFYDGSAWRVADPQGQRFLTDESCYVAMRVWTGDSSGVLGKWHRFRVEPEGLRARWNAE